MVFFNVPLTRFELVRPLDHRILSSAWLPFHHKGVFCADNWNRTNELVFEDRVLPLDDISVI